MRKILLFLSWILIFMCPVKAQNNNISTQMAERIAQRMADSLQLSDSQKAQIYAINIDIYQQKALLRQNTSRQDTLTPYIQQIENKRNVLYKAVLSQDKYLLYKQNKRNLIRGN